MNIRIHEDILFHGREEIRTPANLWVAESDESPIYNIVYSTKIRISIDGREEIRTLLHFIKMKFTSIESPLYNYVYN